MGPFPIPESSIFMIGRDLEWGRHEVVLLVQRADRSHGSIRSTSMSIV